MARSEATQALFAKLSCGLGRRDEEPNREVGRRAAEDRDADAVAALVELLGDRQADSSAVKALYECGYLAPDLLVPHADSFVALLDHRKNRLVWGGMIALTCVAEVAPDTVWPHRRRLLEAFATGTAITRETVVIALAHVAASSSARARALAPWFLEAIVSARPKDLPGWAEKMLPVVGPKARAALADLLRGRLGEVPSPRARARLEKALKG